MFCALSGEVPSYPVVSKVSGHLYEKRLIEKYISDHGRCPITSSTMTEDDLIEVKGKYLLLTLFKIFIYMISYYCN